MSKPDDDFLEGVARDAARRERLAKKNFRFQETVVTHLLKYFRLRGEEHSLRQRCEDQTGERHLLFSWFFDAHRDFPVWLGMKKFKIDVLRQFESRVPLNAPPRTGVKPVCRSALFKAFADVREQAPEGWDRPTALVFYRLHYGAQLKVMHNADLPVVEWQHRFRVPTTGGGSELIHIEDFASMLTALRWSP